MTYPTLCDLDIERLAMLRRLYVTPLCGESIVTQLFIVTGWPEVLLALL